MLLAGEYLEIKYQDKKYKLEELYDKFKNELNLNDKSEDSFYCGLPKDAIVIYKGKEYDSKSYKNLLNLENIELIFKPMEFNNNYLNILYSDFNFHFQIARINLIKSIPIIQSDADINWNNSSTYVGMHYLRTVYFINSCVAYRHLIDKLYKILGIIINYDKVFKTFREFIKKIDERDSFNNYWNNNVLGNSDINGLDTCKIETFRDKIDILSDFLNQNEISNIVNEYKHKGLYIEKGLKISHCSIIKDSNNYYSLNLSDDYGKDVLEFDIDEKIKYLRDYNNMIVDFIKDANTQQVLEHYKFSFGNIILD